MRKKLILTMIIVVTVASLGLSAITHSVSKKPTGYWWSGNPHADVGWNFLKEIEGLCGATAGTITGSKCLIVGDLNNIDYLAMGYSWHIPGDAPGTPAEGQVYANDTDHKLYFYNGSSWVELTAGAGTTSLDEAYNNGNEIAVDGGAVTLTGTHASNPTLLVTKNMGSTGNAITIVNSGDGHDIAGQEWYITDAGVADFPVLGVSLNTILGNGTGTCRISTSSWGVTSAGAVTGLTTLSMSGNLTNTGGDIFLANGKALKSSVTDTQTVGIYAYDVDGESYVPTIKLTNGNTVALALGSGVETVAIDSSDWDISTTGAMSGIGAITMDGLLTGSAGATLSGATINLNASSNFAVNIATGTSTGTVSVGTGATAQTVDVATGAGVKALTLGSTNTSSSTAVKSGSGGVNVNVNNSQPTNINTGTSTGAVTIGGGSGTFAVDSTGLDVSTAGALSGVTTIGMSGNLTISAGDVLLANGKAIKSSTTTGQTIAIKPYDVDGETYVDSILLTNGDTPTIGIGSGVETIAINSGDWDISATGAMTGIGAVTMDGLLTASAGATISGAAISLNANSAYAVNIATGTSDGTVSVGTGATAQTIDLGTGAGVKAVTLGSITSTSATAVKSGSGGVNVNASINQPTNINTGTSTGAVTIGGGSGTFAVASTGLDVSTAGALSGITTIGMSGDLTISAGDIILADGQAIKASTTTAETIALQAYDVDDTTYLDSILLTNGDVPAIAIGSGVETVAVTSPSWSVSTDGAFSGLTTIGMSGDLTISAGDILLATGQAVKASTTTAHTIALQAYDVDNTTYLDSILLTNGDVPAIVIGSGVETVAVASPSWSVSTDGAFSGLTTIGMSGDLTISAGDILLATGKAVKASTTTAHTIALQAYDVDNTTYLDSILLTNGDVPSIAVGSGVETVAVTSADWSISAAGVMAGLLKKVTQVTTNTVLTPAQSGQVFCVAKDDCVVADYVITLPSASAGLWFTIIDANETEAADVTITAGADDKINAGSAAGSYVHDTDAEHYACVTLLAVDDTDWIVLYATGTWVNE